MATNPGITDLISWWEFNEASGNALDSHGTNELVETSGTIASAGGKVGNARDIELGDTEYFTIADNASLSFGDEDFTIGGWYKMESVAAGGANRILISKYKVGTNDREYELNQTNSEFQFNISSNGTATANIATSVGGISAATWYFVVAWHDSVNDRLGIRFNATDDDAAYANGCNDNVSEFSIGRRQATVNYGDGLYDESFVYGKVLSSDEMDWLYNGGNGRSYADLTVTFKPQIMFF